MGANVVGDVVVGDDVGEGVVGTAVVGAGDGGSSPRHNSTCIVCSGALHVAVFTPPVLTLPKLMQGRMMYPGLGQLAPEHSDGGPIHSSPSNRSHIDHTLPSHVTLKLAPDLSPTAICVALNGSVHSTPSTSNVPDIRMLT